MASTIFDSIFNRTKDVLTQDSVPVSNTVAPEVARQVAKAIAPVVENATNQEPWYRSRIYLGLITAAVGLIASKIGVTITQSDVSLVLENGGTIVEALGGLYALYGRIVGAMKKPLGAK